MQKSFVTLAHDVNVNIRFYLTLTLLYFLQYLCIAHLKMLFNLININIPFSIYKVDQTWFGLCKQCVICKYLQISSVINSYYSGQQLFSNTLVKKVSVRP